MSLKLQVKLMETSIQYTIIFKSFVLSLLLWSLKIYVQVSGDFWDNSYWTHFNFGEDAEANEFSLLMKWVNIFAVSSLNNTKPKNNKKELKVSVKYYSWKQSVNPKILLTPRDLSSVCHYKPRQNKHSNGAYMSQLPRCSRTTMAHHGQKVEYEICSSRCIYFLTELWNYMQH